MPTPSSGNRCRAPTCRRRRPAKLVYVHDVRVPGMLHGRVVRPPYAGVDAGPFVGTSLIAVDEASVRDIPGLVAVVRIGDFVGVVAEREENAVKAAARLKVTWKPTPTLPDLERRRDGAARQSVDAADPDRQGRRRRRHRRRRQADGADLCLAVPDARLDRPVLRRRGLSARARSGSGPARKIRTSCAPISRCCVARPETDIEVIRLEAAGCYGRNCADDVSADAVLLSRAVGRPVRVQLTREQEHAWEPKGTAQLMDVNGGLRADGSVAAYDFATRYPPTARRRWRCC